MAYYRGATRKPYLADDGGPIDQMPTRTLVDPTPAHLSLLTDIDRLQWGLSTDWGNPAYFSTVAIRDGGTSGSSGSYAAVANTLPISILVPPRCDEVAVLGLCSGIVKIKLVTTHHAAGVTLNPIGVSGGGPGFIPGSDTFDDPSLAYPHVTQGDPLIVAANTNEGDSNVVAVTVTVTRGDVQPTKEGYGGVLWGLAFFWRGANGSTWDQGDDADAINVAY